MLVMLPVAGGVSGEPDRMSGTVCAATIRAAFDGRFDRAAQPDGRLRISVARVGVHALVGYAFGEEGGTALFSYRAHTWCRTLGGGGALRESDVIGVDGIDPQTAHDLFAAHAVTSVSDAR